MISMVNFSGSKQELELLEEHSRNLAAYCSEDKWNIYSFSLLQELDMFFKEQPMIHLSCYDITEKGNLDYLHHFREHYQKVSLMLIANLSISPMEYIKPDILASELILRPYRTEELKGKLHSLITSYLGKEDEEEVFVLDTKEETLRIPYNQIYYLEALDKKIYVRMKREEKGFYGTLDNLEEKLPESFVRCHRSFIVNWKHVEKMVRSQNLLILMDGMQVPFSRSYKAKLMELVQ